jgi:hypothetical protein
MKLLKTALPAIKAGASQVQRLMQHFGDLAGVQKILQTPGFKTKTGESNRPNVLSVQVDGGYLLTDNGYKETKVGRLFSEESRKVVSSDREDVMKRIALEKSDYVPYLGNYIEFVNRFDTLIAAHQQQSPDAQLVAISDGAEWIRNWLKANHSKVIVILDFYHAAEKMAELATLLFTSVKKRSQWIEKRKQEMLDGKLDKVILAMRTKSAGRRKSIIVKADAVIAYYSNNSYRMKYDEYRAAGYCIGSGAIESTISTVVQQRCKLVGQRWTKRVTAVLNIRSIFKSSKRELLRKLISTQMGQEIAA